jgi:hypothetical protein
MIKILKKLGIEGTQLNIIKAMYDKSKANIVLNGEQLKSFPLKLGMRQELILQIRLDFLTRAIRPEKNK